MIDSPRARVRACVRACVRASSRPSTQFRNGTRRAYREAAYRAGPYRATSPRVIYARVRAGKGTRGHFVADVLPALHLLAGKHEKSSTRPASIRPRGGKNSPKGRRKRTAKVFIVAGVVNFGSLPFRVFASRQCGSRSSFAIPTLSFASGGAEIYVRVNARNKPGNKPGARETSVIDHPLVEISSRVATSFRGSTMSVVYLIFRGGGGGGILTDVLMLTERWSASLNA